MQRMERKDRVVACFQALATGDAVGKQTETLTRAKVRKFYPEGIIGFNGRPGDVIPRYAGARYEWRVGETTDDTEQTLAVIRALLRDGRANHEAIGRELLPCKKSVHPGVSIWPFQQIGDPARIASSGDGCGAAMRVAPIGVIHLPDQVESLIRGAYECSIPTHGGQLAICAAAAVVCAISAALDGQSAADVLAAALLGAKQAEIFRPQTRPSTIAASIETIYSDLAVRHQLSVGEIAEQYFPDKPESIVPLAIGLALITKSAEQTILLAANLGGDSDSVASIGGAIAGALRPETVNSEWFEIVNSTNKDNFLEEVISLATLQPR
jgi:ADP-ribosylglycohydrolase